MKKKVLHTHDLSQAPYTTYGTGPKCGIPKLCLRCAQPIKRGEAWQKDGSALDPNGHGRIVTVQHSPRCPDTKTRTKFHKMQAGGKRR